MRKFIIFIIILAVILAIGGAWYFNKLPTSITQLGKGEPLDQSTSQITVLEEATPFITSPSTPTSATNVSITFPEPQAQKPATFDKTSVQLGTTISLLVSSWVQGGPLPRELANTAAALAEQTGQASVIHAAEALRTATPREGPVTLQLLMLEIEQTSRLTPPEDLPVDDAAAEAAKSWFRKQLEKLIHISTPDTQNRWSSALTTAQQQIARGMVPDAMQTLNADPLANDDRLATLRADSKTYISQSGKLTNLVNAYTTTFLGKDTE